MDTEATLFSLNKDCQHSWDIYHVDSVDMEVRDGHRAIPWDMMFHVCWKCGSVLVQPEDFLHSQLAKKEK